MGGDERQTFGGVVRAARLDARLSLGQLAAEVDRTAASVRRWERDEAVPAAQIRHRLAEVLGLDPELLDRLADRDGAPRATTVSTSIPAATAALAADEPAPPPDPFLGAPTEAMPVPSPPPAPAVERAPVAADETGMFTATTAPVSRRGVAGTLREARRRLFDPDEPWLGYLRGVLTLIAFVVMAWVLMWALGELRDAIGAFFASFHGPEGEPSALVVLTFM